MMRNTILELPEGVHFTDPDTGKKKLVVYGSGDPGLDLAVAQALYDNTLRDYKARIAEVLGDVANLSLATSEGAQEAVNASMVVADIVKWRNHLRIEHFEDTPKPV